MDLSVPGVCQADDLEASPANVPSVASADYEPSLALQTVSSLPTNNSPDAPAPEDCFCCCSHIAPTQIFEIAALISSEICVGCYSSGPQQDYSPFIYNPPKA
jgi:hypothetical protein